MGSIFDVYITQDEYDPNHGYFIRTDCSIPIQYIIGVCDIVDKAIEHGIFQIKVEEETWNRIRDMCIVSGPSNILKITKNREEIASWIHDLWCGWMKYLFKKSEEKEDGSVVISKENVKRWKRQTYSDYSELPDNEKDSDREITGNLLRFITESGKK